MSILSDLKKDSNIEEARDTVGGLQVLESGLYKMTIKVAYITKTLNGALTLNLQMESDKGQTLNAPIYITSGDKKGNKTTYTDKKGVEHYLPGFNLGNSLANVTLGKDLAELPDTEKKINLWNYDANAEVPTKIDAITALHDQKVIVGVIKQLNDKSEKDAKGVYIPTGETRLSNDIDKFFNINSSMTSTETADNATEPVFIHTWAKKWKGELRDRSTKGVTKATSGAPTGNVAPAKSLFVD